MLLQTLSCTHRCELFSFQSGRNKPRNGMELLHYILMLCFTCSGTKTKSFELHFVLVLEHLRAVSKVPSVFWRPRSPGFSTRAHTSLSLPASETVPGAQFLGLFAKLHLSSCIILSATLKCVSPDLNFQLEMWTSRIQHSVPTSPQSCIIAAYSFPANGNTYTSPQL